MATRFESPIQTFEVTVDGKTETFAMTLNYFAIAKLCDLLGVEFDKLDLENVKPTEFPKLVHAALWSLDETKTEADAKRFLTNIRIQDVAVAIRTLIESASPDKPPGGAASSPTKKKGR